MRYIVILNIIAMQPVPVADNMKVLNDILQRDGLDQATIWALIDAFNYGVIVGKQIERQ